jgi:type IX secretion system PorP/SprF family membrane protein
MRKLFLSFASAVLGFICVNAQQDPMVSQYMFNGLYLNPAYAGSHDYWSSTLSYRSQWVGFDGAPETFIASADGPIQVLGSLRCMTGSVLHVKIH